MNDKMYFQEPNKICFLWFIYCSLFNFNFIWISLNVYYIHMVQNPRSTRSELWKVSRLSVLPALRFLYWKVQWSNFLWNDLFSRGSRLLYKIMGFGPWVSYLISLSLTYLNSYRMEVRIRSTVCKAPNKQPEVGLNTGSFYFLLLIFSVVLT